jgi:membrane fusion protein (multidrug efflux system)
MSIAGNIQLLITFILAGSLIGCGTDAEGRNGSGDDASARATDVKVLRVEPRTFDEYIEVIGKVNADIASTVSSEEQGVLKAFLRDKGDWVRQGETVVILDSEALRASFEEVAAAYQLSKATYARQKNLYEDRVISEQKFLEHKFTLDRDKARYDNLKAHLDNTSIKAPISGRIDRKLMEVGEFVMPGTALFELVKTDVVKVAAGAPEMYVRDIRIGSAATITFDVLPGKTFTAPVTFIGPSINSMNRTFPIEIALDNAEGVLKPEMFANIRILKAHLEDVVVIPRDAIIETETGKYAFVVGDGVAERRPVSIGASFNNLVLIDSGLRIGEQLIIVGHRDLVAGEQVAIRE